MSHASHERDARTALITSSAHPALESFRLANPCYDVIGAWSADPAILDAVEVLLDHAVTYVNVGNEQAAHRLREDALRLGWVPGHNKRTLDAWASSVVDDSCSLCRTQGNMTLDAEGRCAACVDDIPF